MAVKVSIILPIYNGEKTLVRTLDSLVNQTFQDFELVVCIDGSKDTSIQILASYASQFTAMVILENEFNLGLGPTMNRLLANTKGEYVAVAEQDDVYVPERLAIQVKVLDKYPEYGMCSGIAEHHNYRNDKTTFKFPGLLVNNCDYPTEKDVFFLLNYTQGVKVTNSCMMLRKKIHINNGLYFSKHLGSVSVDWLYVLRFGLVSKVKGIPATLVILDRTPSRDNVTGNKTKMFASSYELLRMIRYEEPDLVTHEVYKKALVYQNRMQYGHCNFFLQIWNLFSFPLDMRFKLDYLFRKAKNKFKKKRL